MTRSASGKKASLPTAADLAVGDGDAALDDTGGRDDQTVLKNNIGGVLSHNLLREEFFFRIDDGFRPARDQVFGDPSHRPT